MYNIFSLEKSVCISLNESVNVNVTSMCSKLTLPQFQYLFDLSSSKRHDDYSSMTEYTKLINYCNEIINSKNNHQVDYGFALNSDIGRLQSKQCSIQRLYNGFRGILCDKKMFDIDMINSHPQILLNLCYEHSIDSSKLLYYVKNRDQCLQELIDAYDISRAEAKSTFLKCINKIDKTTKINKKKVKGKCFFNDFDNETTVIIGSLYKIYKRDPLYKKYKSADWNKQGKLVNKVLCNIENTYLNLAINELINNKLLTKEDIAVLMFDGFMAYSKDKDADKNIILFLNNLFKQYHIKWTYKEHNIELLEPLLELESKGELLNNDKFNGGNMIEVIDHILKGLLLNKLYKDDRNYYYITHDRIIMNEKMIKCELFDNISKQSYTIFDEYLGRDGAMTHASKVPKHIDTIVNGLLCKCPQNQNFINDIWLHTQFKLFFLNGYFDFKKNKFVQNFECDKSNHTFIKINRKYVHSHNKDLRDEINEKIFYPIFTVDKKNKNFKERLELLDYFKYSVAHYLAGDVEKKRWSLFQGLRNSGKGIIGDLLKNCFEKYVMTTNSGNFNFKKNVTDSQKALSWLLDYQFVRVALTSEIAIADDIQLDGNMLKQFTSGGDYISARKNFQDEKEFRIQSGLIICCNDCPAIVPSDALDLCDEYSMKSKFVDEDFEDKIKGFTYYQKNNTLKSDFLKRTDVINELISMIFESYNTDVKYPQRLRDEYKIDNTDENDYEKLQELFIMTTDIKDFISNQKLKSIIKSYKLRFTLKKVKQLLKGMGASDHRANSTRGLACLKLVINPGDDSDEDNSSEK